jgi:hypothetical protein
MLPRPPPTHTGGPRSAGYWRLGFSFYALGRFQEAADTFMLGLRVVPGNLHFRRGLDLAQVRRAVYVHVRGRIFRTVVAWMIGGVVGPLASPFQRELRKQVPSEE